jgi:hypothetical protein
MNYIDLHLGINRYAVNEKAPKRGPVFTGPLFDEQMTIGYSSLTVMACCGQFSTQVRQLMHSDMFTGSDLPPSTLNTACGHIFTQVPSPSHLALSIVTIIMVP